MVRAQSVTVTLVYTYNAQGLRVAQSVDGDETTFAWDQALPLAQVMARSDGTLDLYGLARTGEVQGGEWAYPLPDALGSVRQWSDSSGAVTYAGGYTPFGTEMWHQGSTTSAWGYTGEWQDSNVEMVYLRARWYAPYLNRFISLDSIAPDVRNPQGINRYLYALANPINYSDPSGLCLDAEFDGICDSSEPDPRDLTDWLYREMVKNANDPVVLKLRAWNKIASGWGGIGLIVCKVGLISGQPIIIVGGGIVVVGGTVFHGTALYEYAQLVKNGARWDVKDEIGIKLGPGITLCSSGMCFNDIEYSVAGNIHFAYIGGAAGIFGWEIQAGAAWAEINDPAHDPESLEYVGPYMPPEILEMIGSTPWDPSTWNFGDDPLDHEAVTLGVKLWENYKYGLTRSQFGSKLAGYIGRLARCTPYTEPVREDVARYWPYHVGYFDNQGQAYVPREGRGQ